VVRRIALGEESEHALTVFDGGVRLRRHHHPVGDLRRACGDELRLAFDGDETNPAIADDRQGGIPAERGDLDASGSRGIEDGVAFRCA